MPLARPSYQDLLNYAIERLDAELGVDASVSTSMAGVIARLHAASLDRLYERLEEIYDQSRLSTATGRYLDEIAEPFGIRRRTTQIATSQGGSRALKFTNNSGAPVSVPEGTRVWTVSDANVAFFTIETINLAPGQEGYVHARAARAGAFYNVGVGELVRTNAPAGVSVTNVIPISNGSDLESDASFRYRIQQELIRRDVLNKENLRVALQEVPGVRDVWVLDTRRGAGTVDVVVLPYIVGDTAEVVAAVQEILNRIVPVGISAEAYPPIHRMLNITVQLNVSTAHAYRRSEIDGAVRTAIFGYVDNVPVEDGTGVGALFTNEILSRVMDATDGILDAIVKIGLDGQVYPMGSVLKPDIGERFVVQSISVV